MSPGGVKPIIPASGRPQTDALDRPASQQDSKNVVPFHAMKANMGELYLHSFFTSPLCGGEWSAPGSARFTPVKELGGPQSLSGYFRIDKHLKINNGSTENPP